MTLAEARDRIGYGVVYHPEHGPAEDGVIVGVSEVYVFVRYRGDEHAKATRPEDLTLLGAR
jgi:hypothetical protein